MRVVDAPLSSDKAAMDDESGIVGSELGMELAERGHTVHFIASALPTRLTELNERGQFHEVEMMSYPLFEHQPYTLALARR